MRNLKRVLSLALALVMVLGMMVITTSAATYADEDEITQIEAVEVLSKLGIVSGDGTNFNPNGTFMRRDAAKLLTYMLIGPDMAEKLAGTDVFTDVDKDHWSAKYIGYCANLGYIAGNGDGTFNPKGELTDIALGKLVLCAIGKDPAKYTGANWASAVTVDLLETGLVKNVTGAVITREDACAMILAAMKYTETPDIYEVRFTDDIKATSSKVSEFDNLLEAELYAGILGRYTETETAGVVTAGVGYYTAKAPATDTLMKEVYGVTYDDETATDDFGRPGIRYTDVKTTGKKVNLFYANEADYTVEVTNPKNDTLAEIAESLDINLNGKSGTYTKGDTIEIYVDKDGKITDAVRLHTELGLITKVTKTTEEDAKYTYVVSVKTDVYGVKNYKDTELAGFDAETMVKDTYVAITKGNNTAIVAVADSITGKQTAKGQGYTKIDGVQKNYAGAVWSVDNMANDFTNTYDVYMDAKGLVIGTVLTEEDKADATIFYVNANNFTTGTVFTGGKKAQLEVIYLDGTSAVVDMVISKDGKVSIGGVENKTLAEANTANPTGFYAYTLNEDGDVKSITAVNYNVADPAVKGFVYLANGHKATFTAEKAKVQWWGDVFYANADTTLTTIKTGVPTNTITGYEKFPSKEFTASASVHALAQFDKDVLKAVWVIGDTASAVADDAVYGWYVSTGDTTYNAAQDTYYTEVVYNVAGVDTTYTINAATVNAANKKLVSIVVNGKGIASMSAAGTTDKVFDKVTDTYVIVNGASDATYLADKVAVYDVTNVTKNGVVAIDEIPTDAVVTYTTNPQSKITAVYVTYAAQEDGVISLNKSSSADVAYFETVLGLNPAALTGLSDTATYAVVQYSRPVNSGSKTFTFNFWNVETPETVNSWNLNAGYNPTTGEGVLVSSPSGATNTYAYQIVFDGSVIQAGSFTLSK